MDSSGAPPPAAPDNLQFDKAEFEQPRATRACGSCGQNIALEYFAAGDMVVCPACADRVSGAGASKLAVLRAIGYGLGAALLGTLVWWLIMKITGLELGIVAIAVGYLVGYAVRRGSDGAGGWRFQAIAMALTYLSITASYVPLVLEGLRAGPGDPTLALGLVLGLALAGPFLAGVKNILGIFIIGVALYEAWKLNKRLVLSGPFRLQAAPAPAPAAAGGSPPA